MLVDTTEVSSVFDNEVTEARRHVMHAASVRGDTESRDESLKAMKQHASKW